MKKLYLNMVKEGVFVIITNIECDINLAKKINGFGLLNNQLIHVERNNKGIIISINGRLIMLSEIIASKIAVKYADSNNR